MIQFFIDLLFPKICPGCDNLLLEAENVICTGCRHEIPLTLQHLVPNNEAASKLYGRLELQHISALCYFNKKGVVQHLIHKLKYRGQEEIGAVLGQWYSAELTRSGKMPKVDIVVPVPLHPRRMRQRGYNQVSRFAREMAKGLDTEFSEDILHRTRYSLTQTGKNMLSRATSAATFTARTDNVPHGCHFLLVDDVITTGSTLEACGKALLQIPDSKISIVCIAMSHS